MAGDQALAAVAASLLNNIRPEDLLARFGGEEFVIGLPNTGLDEAFIVAERVRRAISSCPWASRRGEDLPHLTISIGIGRMQPGNIAGLITAADEALTGRKAADATGSCFDRIAAANGFQQRQLGIILADTHGRLRPAPRPGIPRRPSRGAARRAMSPIASASRRAMPRTTAGEPAAPSNPRTRLLVDRAKSIISRNDRPTSVSTSREPLSRLRTRLHLLLCPPDTRFPWGSPGLDFQKRRFS